MLQVWERIKNEPAVVAGLILATFDGLVVFDVLTMTLEQFGWINMVLSLVFGVSIRQTVYSPQSFSKLEGELLDQ